MKALPKPALVAICIGAGLLAAVLTASVLFALAVGVITVLPLTGKLTPARFGAVLGLGVVAGLVSGLVLRMAGIGPAAGVPFAGAFATVAVFAGGYFVSGALRRAQTLAPEVRQAALSQTPPTGCGRVIVYRHGLLGYGNAVEVLADGHGMAQLSMGRFTVFDLPAGSHRLGAAMVTMAGPGVITEVACELAAGQTVALRVVLAWAQLAKGRVGLEHDPDPATAAHRLARRTLVAPTAMPQPQPQAQVP